MIYSLIDHVAGPIVISERPLRLVALKMYKSSEPDGKMKWTFILQK